MRMPLSLDAKYQDYDALFFGVEQAYDDVM